MKVAKLVRLKSKDEKGAFKKDGAFEVVRNRAIVSEETVKQSEAEYPENGLLYIVDEKATKERDELKANGKKAEKESKEKKKETPEKKEPAPKKDNKEAEEKKKVLDGLRKQYKELSGNDPAQVWGADQLTKEIEKLAAKKE